MHFSLHHFRVQGLRFRALYLRCRVYVYCKFGGQWGLGFRVQGLGLKGCREKCENGREKKYNGPLVRLQSSSLSPSSSPCRSPGARYRRLFKKMIEGLIANQWPSSWRRAPAEVGRVGWASTNTGRFLVDSSRCWQRLARLRKKCYHSCDTDLVLESERV